MALQVDPVFIKLLFKGLHTGSMYSPLCESPPEAEEGRCQSQKKPCRILHFSDGVMEEYSSDEEEGVEERKKLNPNPMPVMDPKTLKWGSWLYYWMLYGGNSALSACDYIGESLANVLGITSPKYQYEIDEYNAAVEEEKNEKEEQDAQMAGWTTTAPASPSEGIKHKIVDSSVLQEPSQPQPPSLDQVKCETEVPSPNETQHPVQNGDANSGKWERF